MAFPWTKPASGLAKAAESNGFEITVGDRDILDMVGRNQVAHAVVVDVASDAVNGFECMTPRETPLPEFDAMVKMLFVDKISKPLTDALMFCRMYGYCGLLIGYADGSLEGKAKEGAEIEYLQPIPKNWVDEIIYVEKEGSPILPLTIEKYKVNISSKSVLIDASRMIHLSNPSLDASSLEGDSSIKCVYDLCKVVKSMDWGTGQAMWRHGGGLTAFVVPDSRDQQAQIDAIAELVVDINAMTTLVLPNGTTVESEGNIGLNPEPYYKVIVQQIAVGTRIPTSILTGSQAGTLTASMKDRHDYFELLGDIQSDILTPVLTDILKRCQLNGMLPDVEFMIKWDECPDWLDEIEAKPEPESESEDRKKTI